MLTSTLEKTRFAFLAYILGMGEFRLGYTWSDDRGNYTRLDDAYDRGRNMAHRLTFRMFD